MGRRRPNDGVYVMELLNGSKSVRTLNLLFSLCPGGLMRRFDKQIGTLRRDFLGLVLFSVYAISGFGLSSCASSLGHASSSYFEGADDIPVTQKSFNNDGDDFTFAVVADLSGGERAGVFDVAVSRVNLFSPSFVMSVGDLIDGAPFNEDETEQFWDVFDGKVANLEAPFFYVVGNHDIYSLNTREIWERRYGKRYYHFIYKNVLFLVLDTEDYDPSSDPTAFELDNLFANNALGKIQEYADKYGSEQGGRKWIAALDWEGTLDGSISDEQVAYFTKVISENTDVRHTFVFMHQPMWQGDVLPSYAEIERALSGRRYTAFSGHAHHYRHTNRNGAMHIRLGTTGGGWVNKDIDGNFDHITIVTVSEGGPRIANIRLDGVFGYEGHKDKAEAQLCFSEKACLELPKPD